MNDLAVLLRSVVVQAGKDFSGIGVVVCTEPDELPIYPLRPLAYGMAKQGGAAQLLAEISTNGSPFHDGFHILRSDLSVSRISQYFSPPIARVKLDPSLLVGGRYMAAIFGSMLSLVHSTGVVGIDRRLAIFQRGEEVHTETIA